MKFVDPDGKFPIIPAIIIGIGLWLNSDVAVAPTGNPSDGPNIQEARNNYNMNNLGILVPLPGGAGASTLSGAVGKQFIKETGKQAEKQVVKEIEKQVGKQAGEKIIKEAQQSAKKENPKKAAREQAKTERDNQPASENYAKYKAKELEKAKGKDAR